MRKRSEVKSAKRSFGSKIKIQDILMRSLAPRFSFDALSNFYIFSNLFYLKKLMFCKYVAADHILPVKLWCVGVRHQIIKFILSEAKLRALILLGSNKIGQLISQFTHRG